MREASPTLAEERAALSRALGAPVGFLRPIGGGRNSRVYEVACESGQRYAAKFYFRHRLDGRDRLAVEFSSLAFLRRHGVSAVPRPIRADADGALGIYEYIEGQPIPPGAVTESDLDAAVEFLATLHAVGTRHESRALGPASEACFSIDDMVHKIEDRLARLLQVQGEGSPYRALNDFLTREFMPRATQVTRWCQSQMREAGIAPSAALPLEERTLSPSDFGFHNALRRAGHLVFLDFEYFGWDDPAKTVADFLLHPAMRLPDALKRRFVAGLLTRVGDGHGRLSRRVTMLYPLCGLKWCLILLNEFVPQDLLRRGFANGLGPERERIQLEQLAKAKRMLDAVDQDHERVADLA